LYQEKSGNPGAWARIRGLMNRKNMNEIISSFLATQRRQSIDIQGAPLPKATSSAS
jgi:hypothetical protein